jgi:hypothetical protein
MPTVQKYRGGFGLTTTRRSMLATLFSVPLAKLWSRAVKSKVGPVIPLNVAAMENAYAEATYGADYSPRPFPMPTAYLSRHADVLTMNDLQLLCSAYFPDPNHPSVILVGSRAYCGIWGGLAPMDRWAVMGSELVKRGFTTFSLCGVEVVLDRQLKDGEVWHINPKDPGSLALNNLLTYRAIDIHPRPYTPLTPEEEEIAEWRDEYEDYADD